jgi:hypothetical protein
MFSNSCSDPERGLADKEILCEGLAFFRVQRRDVRSKEIKRITE